MSRRRQDSFGHRAKREGFPARSVYKLEEIDQRVRLLRPGQRVLDLGAFPGSWTLYAAERVGAKGAVVGVDVQEHRGTLPPNARIVQADVTKLDATEVAKLGGPFDVVLSDMAPSTTGTRHLDQYRSYELFMSALGVAREALAKGGSFVGKIFQGPDIEDARRALAEAFAQTRIVKPRASRSESYEIFLVGLGRRG